jgi:hypothetical protein
MDEWADARDGYTTEDLPDELLIKIFSWTSMHTVKTILSLVCRRWYELGKNNSFYKYIYIGERYGDDLVVSLLESVPLLGGVEFCNRKDLGILLGKVVGLNRKLKRLKICASRDRTVEVGSRALLEFIDFCPCLERLTLKRVTFDDPDLIPSKLWDVAPQLTHLNLNHGSQLGSKGLQDIADNCSYLQDLRIYCVHFDTLGSLAPYDDGPAVRLFYRLSESLTVLKLNMLGLTDAAMQYLCSCHRLNRLHMYRLINIHDEFLLMIENLSELKELVITVPRAITSEGWIQLFSKPNMASLQKLTLSNSYTVNNEVLGTLASHCLSIKELGIPGCGQVTQPGVEAVVRSCSKLNYLNLFATRATVSYAFELIPDFLPDLKTLVYRTTDQEVIDVYDVLSRLPAIQLRDSYRYI